VCVCVWVCGVWRSAEEGEVTINSNRALLEGSSHVTDLNLQERYACSARFAWSAVSPVRLCLCTFPPLPSACAAKQ